MQETKVYFKNRKGEKLCGIFTAPEDTSKKYPLVILCHGFSSSKDSKTYPPFAKRLFENNILSFRFDFYGHGESEGKFEDITITEGYNDILSAITYIKNLGYIEKIGLFGNSFGGVCGIMAASKSKDITALGLRAPAADMIENRRIKLGEKAFKEWKQKGFSIYKNKDGKEFKLNHSFLEDAENIDAYDAAKKIKVPTLIIHGDKDQNVPISQSEKLTKNIKGSRLEVFNGANHFFDKTGEKEAAMSRFVNFFKEALK